jgi:DNA mismatch repair protein MutS
MVEMVETARILRQAGKRSLVVLDEIGRGTSTFDGLSLAWAVVENLASKGQGGVRTLFATHYHELTDLEGRIQGIRNYNIAVKEWKGEIVFLRRMVPGPADRSYGIEVAKLAGIPQPVIQRAKEILSRLESKSEQLKLSGAERRKPSQSLLPGLLARPGQEGRQEKESPSPAQEPGEHPLLQELRKVDPDNMTPVQALSVLADWKQRWDSDGDGKD